MPIKAPHGPITSAEPPHGASTDTQPPQGAATEPVSPHSMLGRRMASPSATSNRVPPRLQRQSSGAPGARLDPQLTPNYITGARRQLTAACTCRAPAHQSLKRPPPSIAATQALAVQAETRTHLWERIHLQHVSAALQTVGLSMPAAPSPSQDGGPVLNKPLQRVLSDFIRRTHISLPKFVELLCVQTVDDYRPDKNIILVTLRHACRGYEHLEALLGFAQYRVRTPLVGPWTRQRSYPPNHQSATDRYHILVKNIRKEQDNWRCIVVDLDILEIWPDVHVSPFGVVDKGDDDPLVNGRVIHDLSYPDGQSLNDQTDTSRIFPPSYQHCDAIASEVITQQQNHPGTVVKLQAGDVASTFGNVYTHSESAYRFGGRLEPDNALVIDMSTAFGWSGSPGSYGVVGGAIAHVHGNSVTPHQPSGVFNFKGLEDHINVAADIGNNCSDTEQSLRHAMITVLGHAAINEDKFTP